MNPALLSLPAAFGLAGASGLNATLPLLIVSLLARLGLIHLGSPYDALASDVAFYGLIVLAVVEFAIDKVPALDSVGHAVMLPLAAASGAILFASQTGAVTDVHPGLAVIISVLAGAGVSSTVHVVRAGVRPMANVVLLGPPLSFLEDTASAALSLAATLTPILVPFLLALIVLGAVLLWQRRRASRPSPMSVR
ncbi:MAG: DUF4126 domain-containing protein [Chloroflexi bacterium]|nr:MAG: DUF4126 domain-containing protein [Chloroflexota bacterium]